MKEPKYQRYPGQKRAASAGHAQKAARSRRRHARSPDSAMSTSALYFRIQVLGEDVGKIRD
jgi:hypothetical protein